MLHRGAVLALLLSLAACAPLGGVHGTPGGKVQGTATMHDAASSRAAIEGAQVALPSRLTGGAPYVGRWRDMPRLQPGRVPVVVFLHGSSGLGLPAIAEWQRWLAGLGIASVAPDSFALPGRLRYTSPIDKPTYERIHALRASEIALAQQALAASDWADPRRLVLAGTSEGAVAVARHGADDFAGRIIYAWSCEDNYFVERASTAATPGRPVLNVIGMADPYFSATNAWLGQPQARGHCAAALQANPQAMVVLLAQAPHTLIHLPQARAVTAAFLQQFASP